MSESAAEMILRHEKDMLEMYRRNESYWLSAAARSMFQTKMCLLLFVPFGFFSFQYVLAVVLAFLTLLYAAEGHDSYKRRKMFAREYTDKICATKLQISMTESMLVMGAIRWAASRARRAR